MYAEYYRVGYKLCCCEQSTTESGISSVVVSTVLQSQSVLLVLAQYNRVRYQFFWCYQGTTESRVSSVVVSSVLHRQASVLFVSAE